MLCSSWFRPLSIFAWGMLSTGCSRAFSSEGAGTEGGSGAGGGGESATLRLEAVPIDVAPGRETTLCITKRLGNAEASLVRRFRAQLSEGSHHMIVYRSSASQERPDPEPCMPFVGLLGGDHPIFIAQQPDAELVFPTDDGLPVGFPIERDQMLRIEIHAINTGAHPITVFGSALLDTIPRSPRAVRSDLAFWGTTVLNGGGSPPSRMIPPHSRGDSGVRFQRGLASTRSFALTTHQHHLGTRMRVWYASGPGDTDEPPLVDSTNWADPVLAVVDPPVEFPADGGGGLRSPRGLAYRCEWHNPTPDSVHFGESARDEMCFLWHYYYPAQGFQMCIDDLCTRPIDGERGAAGEAW